MRRLWRLAPAVLFISGCISAVELRAYPPARAGEAPGDYLSLAGCVVAKARHEPLSSRVSYEIQDSAATRTARVIATSRYPGGLFYTVPAALVELTFREPDKGRVMIETRNGPLGWQLEEAIVPLINECANGKASLSS